MKKLIGADHIGMSGEYDGIVFTITSMEGVSSYPKLPIELARRGWTEKELKKIAGENPPRVLEEAGTISQTLQKQHPPSSSRFSDERLVMQINKVRLIAAIHHSRRRAYIRAVLTRAEYDEGKCKE